MNQSKLSIRDYPIDETVGPYDVKIQIKACGICGSDIHYYLEGAIGDFVVKEPMILGHEAAEIIIEKGDKVGNTAIGDFVCDVLDTIMKETRRAGSGSHH